MFLVGPPISPRLGLGDQLYEAAAALAVASRKRSREEADTESLVDT